MTDALNFYLIMFNMYSIYSLVDYSIKISYSTPPYIDGKYISRHFESSVLCRRGLDEIR